MRLQLLGYQVEKLELLVSPPHLSLFNYLSYLPICLDL